MHTRLEAILTRADSLFLFPIILASPLEALIRLCVGTNETETNGSETSLLCELSLEQSLSLSDHPVSSRPRARRRIRGQTRR